VIPAPPLTRVTQSASCIQPTTSLAMPEVKTITPTVVFEQLQPCQNAAQDGEGPDGDGHADEQGKDTKRDGCCAGFVGELMVKTVGESNTQPKQHGHCRVWPRSWQCANC
jgi:hypothetical protein